MRSTETDIFRKFVRFFLDRNVCSIYNKHRTKILSEVFLLTTIGYVIVILGALSVSVNLMHLVDRLEAPRARQHRRNAA